MNMSYKDWSLEYVKQMIQEWLDDENALDSNFNGTVEKGVASEDIAGVPLAPIICITNASGYPTYEDNGGVPLQVVGHLITFRYQGVDIATMHETVANTISGIMSKIRRYTTRMGAITLTGDHSGTYELPYTDVSYSTEGYEISGVNNVGGLTVTLNTTQM